MMALGGMERSEKQWYDLIEGVGLKITKVNHPPPRAKLGTRTNDSVIEVILPAEK